MTHTAFAERSDTLRRVQRVAFFVIALAGCASLTGLDDLTTDLPGGVGAPDRRLSDASDTTDSAGPSSTGDGGTTGDGAGPNPGNDGSPGTPDAGGSTRIRNITFEDGALVHPTSGFDSTGGSPQLLSQGPLAGAHSMLVDGVGHSGTVSFPAVADLYLTMRLRIDPAGSTTAGDARFLRITHAGGAPVEAFVRASPRDLVVIQGNSSLGSFGNVLTDGTIYRLEIRMRSTGSITTRLVNGGSTSSVGGSGTFGAVAKVEVGAITGGTMRATFDDVLLDSAVQP